MPELQGISVDDRRIFQQDGAMPPENQLNYFLSGDQIWLPRAYNLMPLDFSFFGSYSSLASHVNKLANTHALKKEIGHRKFQHKSAHAPAKPWRPLTQLALVTHHLISMQAFSEPMKGVTLCLKRRGRHQSHPADIASHQRKIG